MTDTITARPVSFRLTGRLLIDTQNRLEAAGYSRAEAVIACGYKRPDGGPSYTEFYTEKRRALDHVRRWQVKVAAQQSPRYHSLIEAIRKVESFERGEYRVVPYSLNGGSVYHGRTILLTFCHHERQVTIFKCNPSRPIKERLNRILMELCGLKLFRKGESWTVVYPTAPAREYETGARFDML